MSKCTCGCTVIDEDHVLGTRVCHECGIVLEENTLVSELSFQETSGGACVMLGRMIYEDNVNRQTLPMLRLGNTEDSQEVTLANARKKMTIIANQLNLNQNCVNTALRFYKLALHFHLTMGRPVEQVAASLLYLACRLDGAPYMLLDFCDVVEVNLYTLGRIFVFFCRKLYINVPPTDPSIYVLRFARNLNFGDKENLVVTLALRIVKRLQRDWIAIGRRPAGICGAALLLAGRYHNFNLTIQDVVDVVHVCVGVLKNRLKEFARTPSAKLTLREFALIDLEEECDPPCFKRVVKHKEPDESVILKLGSQLVDVAGQVENALEEKVKRKRGRPKASSNYLFDWDAETSEAKIEAKREECGATVSGCMDGSSSSNVVSDDTPVLPSLEMLGIKPQRRRAEKSEKPSECKDDSTNVPSDVAPSPADEKESSSADQDCLDDIDVSNYLLTESEVLLKTKIWTRFNGEFWEQQRLKLAEQQENEKKVKKRPPKRRKQAEVAETVNEAIGQIIQKKRLSNKINYDVLTAMSDDEGGWPSSVKPKDTVGTATVVPTPSSSALPESCSTSARRIPDSRMTSMNSDSWGKVNASASEKAPLPSSRSSETANADGTLLTTTSSSTESSADGQQTKRKFFRYKVKPNIPPQRNIAR